MKRMLLGLALVAASSFAMAGDKVNEAAKADYVAYCASCHGVDGTGNGPLADTLKVRPADLTVISKKNGGHFPYTMLRKTHECRRLHRVHPEIASGVRPIP